MKIIIGLGNPGKQYENTRHNAGFILLDKIREDFALPDFVFNKKFNSEMSEGEYQIQDTKCKIMLVKPQTFMNLSGKSVRAILDFYKLSPADIIVIHDDLDIKLGTFKIATNSSSAGHNGVQNIIDTLGTQEFQRLRIGIGQETTNEPSCRIGAHDFVLGKFSNEELKKILELSKEIKKIL
ncbi:MAG TPA: aminoacyl-tRNA hydrolase [Candidatus Moranbacteria bacterium]|nr:aminoacyl-tRNA hydrolase [Candidatus Moranbacteria bacterium]